MTFGPPAAATARRAELTVEDGIARLRLVRADAHNAIDPAWVQAVDDGITACDADPSVRALLICAEGPTFSVGGDLNHFAANLERLSDALDEMIGPYHRSLALLAELPVPVVCAVQGGVGGGGLGLLWCADVVLAADDMKLATGFARLGLSGDGGSSWWLPRLVGIRRARELMLGGRVLSAAEALEWGLVNRVVERERLESEALALMRELAAGPTAAYGEMRQLLARSGSISLADGLDAELDACRRGGATADAREGIAAFVERRAPRFQAR
jgi:2-(1,2-epoxy-1,2-dihydrophenyl)acetyl-CoA isomerase